MAADAQIQLGNKQHDALLEYYKSVFLTVNASRTRLRTRMINQDKLYQRENDETEENRRAKNANRAGDPTRTQNIIVPVVKPQVETAVTFQSAVFLTATPMFSVVSNPEFIDEALQLQTVLENQSIVGGWSREFTQFFRDGYKYNYSVLEPTWEQRTVAALETDTDFSQVEARPTTILYAGNSIKRLDPYNTFQDPNVMPADIYKDGEFAGYTKLYSRINFKKFLGELRSKQTRDTAAFESHFPGVTQDVSAGDGSYFIPSINFEKDDNEVGKYGTNWMKWAGLTDAANIKGIEYRNFYQVSTLYGRILPGEFALNVPNRQTPQIWKLIVVNNSVIVSCERQTNAHNWIPMLIGQPSEDGLAYQTKSLIDDGEPFQAVTSAFMNSMVASRRRAINDRVLFDPSRIASAQINSPNPSAKMPVKPAAYGKNISESVYAFPYREDQNAMSMTQIRELLSMSNNLVGQNPARQGQFVKGNKLQNEFDEIMSNATAKDQMAAMLTENQIFAPLKQLLKLNILQYQGTETLYSRQEERAVEVDPVALRKATLEFKLSDGLVPADKIIKLPAFTAAMQTIASNPQIGAGYNIAPMFSYLIKTQGADLRPFEKSPEQVAFEQALGQWQQLAQIALEKGLEPGATLPPQPKPQDFGYNPSGQKQQGEGSPITGEANAA